MLLLLYFVWFPLLKQVEAALMQRVNLPAMTSQVDERVMQFAYDVARILKGSLVSLTELELVS